ncbi:hypothetical protein BGZ83_010457 [Gryganskiella cystojenkinii]|nr:hypothetical protein BGZ83_010457 [Gryganskiella cystojenkinii]
MDMNPHRPRKPTDGFDETPEKYPSQFPPNSDGKNPHVLIVGAGIGGLFLAIVLDRAGIPYQIFERSAQVKALGSFLGINANILPVFEQLGLYEEFKEIALPNSSVEFLYGSMKKIAQLSSNLAKDPVGYDYMLFARSRLYDLLLSKVPANKIHFNKKVLSIMQNKEGSFIRCADGTTYHGDILVGADGAYSAVRQSLYKQLSDKKKLPSNDNKEMNKGYTCLVGTTNPMDPEKYKIIKDGQSVFHQVIGDGTPYSWTLFNVAENRMCYLVICQFATLAESEDEKFRNSEWGPERSAAMMEKVRDFKVPYGMTLGDLFDMTPREKISRVYLEDKLFETWTIGRTVLIGDAAHKLLPSAGQGAICAMQDAVILANCLYDLESLTYDSIVAALQDYREQRYPQVKIQFDQSNVNAFLYHGQTLKEKIIRHVIFKWIPKSLTVKAIVREASYRPEIAFLPPPPKRGTGPVQPQRRSRRYQEEQQKKREEEERGETGVVASAPPVAL